MNMKRIIITSGGTCEKIDNVRKITNSSSGKLGMTIANCLLKTNDDITIYYVCSKTSLRPLNERVNVIEVTDVDSLKDVITNLLIQNKIDYFVHAMAVSDYKVDYITNLNSIKESINKYKNIDEGISNVEKINDSKISSYEDNLVIILKRTPKIISMIKEISPSTHLIGFKLLDSVSKSELLEVAKKLREKNRCDYVVANDLETIRNGCHKAYIVGSNNIIDATGKEDIAKKLVRVINCGK